MFKPIGPVYYLLYPGSYHIFIKGINWLLSHINKLMTGFTYFYKHHLTRQASEIIFSLKSFVHFQLFAYQQRLLSSEITFANSLEVWTQDVGPDLDPNCVTLW